MMIGSSQINVIMLKLLVYTVLIIKLGMFGDFNSSLIVKSKDQKHMVLKAANLCTTLKATGRQIRVLKLLVYTVLIIKLGMFGDFNSSLIVKSKDQKHMMLKAANLCTALKATGRQIRVLHLRLPNAKCVLRTSE